MWLRLLDSRDLDDITMDSYSDRAQSGFETEGYNRRGLWPWEREAFQSAIDPFSHVLVAGAGGGREMIALAEMGHRVAGFDASRDLVEACRGYLKRAGVKGIVHWTLPGTLPAGLQRYEALVIGRGVYHHIPRQSRRVDFLRACRSLLGPGAPLLLGDVMVTADHPQQRICKGVEAGDFVGSAFFHRFTRAEIELELDQAGFALIDFRPTPFPGEETLAHAIARAR